MSNGTVIRKNIESLDEEELTQLRLGYARMQAISDNRGFNYIAGFHGVPDFYCHNNEALFLPWHRAYVYHFEQYLQDRVEGLAVPWWDWTANNNLPQAFSSATTPTGDPNPLFKSRIRAPLATPPIDRDTLRFPGRTSQPLNLPAPRDVAALLDITDYAQFSDRFNFGIHGRVHIWTGGSGIDPTTGARVSGDMAQVDFAAYDPIFFSHHCMCDRIWYLWQLQHGITNIPTELLNRPLPPFNLTVADVLDISQLGYDYAIDRITITVEG
ncbi:MAG: tyrosinase family protein [Cyanosarcina radialis HA8281-LM2]|jgi:tyrosinase|nr:tyrosinase family protein [Cyanosarcina radialis HA8281-LM2]